MSDTEDTVTDPTARVIAAFQRQQPVYAYVGPPVDEPYTFSSP